MAGHSKVLSRESGSSRKPVAVWMRILRKKWTLLKGALVCLFFTAIASSLSYNYAEDFSERKLSERANNSLSLVASTLEATIGRYQYLPDVIALAPEVRNLFAETPAQADSLVNRRQVANSYLERVNSTAGSAVLYVLDHEGTGIASSNWRDPIYSFVDKSYKERPYRIEAMSGGEGRFYGEGKTTLIPGYFLAAAIRKDGDTAGIAVVKIDLAMLEKEWKSAEEPVAVADENGVLFLSAEAVWRYRPLVELGSAALAGIQASKQYPDLRNEPLLGKERPYRIGRLVRLNRTAKDDLETRILFTRTLPALSWTLVYFGDPAEVTGPAAFAAALAALAVIAVFLGAFVIHARLRTLQVERKAKQELEIRVQERTSELSQANLRLLAEVEERRKTEAELFRTRDRLIEAARRAALGQFLAGLVHETNQPLAALRTYLASTKLLVAKEKIGEAATNLTTMQTVLDHLSQLSGRLKMMIRGDTKELQPANLSESGCRVVSLLKPHFEALGIALTVDLAPDIWVRGDSVRLDQVLLNLLNNASDALSGREGGHVRISLSLENGRAILLVEDNGPGVPAAQISRLFEPFFTTKERGMGSGLGLVTVQRIVADHDGTIEYRRSDLGGAAFQILFPAASARAALAEPAAVA
jgi:two-component system, NtrC family, C4-dicarboxylate transport sensor histidine kinase DctB